MKKILESKRTTRKKLAALPFARKLELLEKLRERSLLIASSPLRQRQSSKRPSNTESSQQLKAVQEIIKRYHKTLSKLAE